MKHQLVTVPAIRDTFANDSWVECSKNIKVFIKVDGFLGNQNAMVMEYIVVGQLLTCAFYQPGLVILCWVWLS